MTKLHREQTSIKDRLVKQKKGWELKEMFDRCCQHLLQEILWTRGKISCHLCNAYTSIPESFNDKIIV